MAMYFLLQVGMNSSSSRPSTAPAVRVEYTDSDEDDEESSPDDIDMEVSQ